MRSGGFSPASLFAGGIAGAWYGPSDLSTLFQDSAGTTPVTTTGQPVGLMLDKSQGLVLGAELVDLTVGPAGVTFVQRGNLTEETNGYWTMETDELINNFGVVTASAYSILEVGSFHLVTIDVENFNSTGKLDALISGAQNTSVSHTGITITSAGSFSFIAYANSTYMDTITLRTDDETEVGGTIRLKTSIRKILGNHAVQATAAARPTYQTSPDRATLDKVDDRLSVTVPVGGFTGTMVLATDQGTASYGVNIPAGPYDIGGLYFPGNAIVGQVIRDGALSAGDAAATEAYFVANGATAGYGAVTNFSSYWRDWSEITSFPLIDTSSGTIFYQTWFNNTSLTSFPANAFNNVKGGDFTDAFKNTALTQTSIDNILVSLVASGIAAGTRVFDQSGGSAPSAAGEAAIDTLWSRGWTVTVTGGYFSPSVLFAGSIAGAWYGPSDLSTLVQDSAGTTPVTTAGQPVGLMLDKSGRANHATQATAAARPTYQTGPARATLDKVDDRLSVTVPTGGFTGTMVLEIGRAHV